MKSIKLAHGVDRQDNAEIKDYKVVTVKNSTEFAPGAILNKRTVDEMCAAKHWDVTIVPLDLTKQPY